MRKFVGEYASGVKNEEDVVYSTTAPHTSLESAMADAIAKGKAANVMEWVSVSEYVWTGHKITGHWSLVSRVTGDYEFQEEALL